MRSPKILEFTLTLTVTWYWQLLGFRLWSVYLWCVCFLDGLAFTSPCNLPSTKTLSQRGNNTNGNLTNVTTPPNQYNLSISTVIHDVKQVQIKNGAFARFEVRLNVGRMIQLGRKVGGGHLRQCNYRVCAKCCHTILSFFSSESIINEVEYVHSCAKSTVSCLKFTIQWFM